VSNKKIFLSYRRDDAPGYVARLEDDLERAFGNDRVFRDVEDISGGAEWRRALEENLAISGALMLIIGPRWADIWRARSGDEVNYIAFELERARELGIPVMPVTLNHASIPGDLDLGEVSWLRDKQFYDISDRQGRWQNDVRGLVRTLAELPTIGPPIAHGYERPSPAGDRKPKRSMGLWLGVASAVAVVIGAWVWLGANPETPPDDTPGVQVASEPEPPVNERSPVAPAPPVAAAAAPIPREAEVAQGPDISGAWVSQKDGTAYFVTRRDDGTFSISSPGYGEGEAAFIPNMPRKFRVEMYGIGHGEFAVSNTDESAIGWLMNHESNRKEYDTLQRVDR
jgi:hypothetical protein